MISQKKWLLTILTIRKRPKFSKESNCRLIDHLKCKWFTSERFLHAHTKTYQSMLYLFPNFSCISM